MVLSEGGSASQKCCFVAPGQVMRHSPRRQGQRCDVQWWRTACEQGMGPLLPWISRSFAVFYKNQRGNYLAVK